MRKRLSKWMLHLWLIVAILPLRVGASESAWIAQPPRDHLFKEASFVALQSSLQQTSNVISRIKYQEISLGAFENYPILVQQFLPAAQHSVLNSTTIVNSDFDEDHQGYFSHLRDKGFGDWVLPTLVALCFAIVLLLIGWSGLYCFRRLSSLVLIVFTLVITWFLVALYRDGGNKGAVKFFGIYIKRKPPLLGVANTRYEGVTKLFQIVNASTKVDMERCSIHNQCRDGFDPGGFCFTNTGFVSP